MKRIPWRGVLIILSVATMLILWLPHGPGPVFWRWLIGSLLMITTVYLALVVIEGKSALMLVPSYLASLYGFAWLLRAEPLGDSLFSKAHLFAIVAELFVLAFVLTKMGRLLHVYFRLRGSGHHGEASISGAIREVIGHGLAGRAIAAEFIMWYVVFGGYRAHAQLSGEERRFEVQNPSETSLRSVFIGLLIFETLVIHFVATKLGYPVIAWLLTLSSVYFMFWLWADSLLLKHQPVLLRAESLDLRIGMRWRVSIPLARIRFVAAGKPPENLEGPMPLAFVHEIMGGGNIWLSLDEPIEIEGAFGFRKTADCLSFWVDQPTELVEMLSAACPPFEEPALIPEPLVEEPEAAIEAPELFFAVRENRLNVVKVLMRGIDPKVTDEQGKTLLDLALELGHQELAQLLIERGVTRSS